MPAPDLTPAAFAAQAQRIVHDIQQYPDVSATEVIAAALGAVYDAAFACDGAGLACCDRCDRTHTHGCLHPLREEVRQLREALQRILHETGLWNAPLRPENSLRFINELAAHALATTEPSHG